MRILIIKTSSLGDIIHALPVIGYLSRISPGIEIDWVVEEQFLPILEHNPLLSRIHIVRTKKWRKAPFSPETRRDLKALRQTLRERSFDLVFDIQGNLKSGLIARLCGAKERIGFDADAVQEKANLLFTTRRVPFRPQDRNVTDRYLRIVSAPFGGEYAGSDHVADMFSAPEDEATAEAYMASLAGEPVFLFQVGTTWQTKLWRPEGWSELARRMVERYPGAVILINWGSPEEKAWGERIALEVGGGVRLLPWLKIRELIPVIRRVDLVIGGDTGPLYMAAAVGTPTVSYYRATDASRYAPQGERHISIQAPMECAGCQRTTCNRDEECRGSITVDAMFEAIMRLIG